MNDSIIGHYEQQLVKTWPKKVHEDIAMIVIMERMHRSYDDYINTPARIIDLIMQKFIIDDKHSADGKGN